MKKYEFSGLLHNKEVGSAQSYPLGNHHHQIHQINKHEIYF